MVQRNDLCHESILAIALVQWKESNVNKTLIIKFALNLVRDRLISLASLLRNFIAVIMILQTHRGVTEIFSRKRWTSLKDEMVQPLLYLKGMQTQFSFLQNHIMLILAIYRTVE